MSQWKVPVQSLIDHIKTAVDVDPWAKEMAEELLDKQIPKPTEVTKNAYNYKFYHCPNCHREFYSPVYTRAINYCDKCGQAVNWE